MYPDLFDVKGKVIGITGGGGYLGREMALGFSAAGADVFICGRTEEKLKTVAENAKNSGFSGQIFYKALDVTDANSIALFLDHIQKERGFLSGWINNAASGVNQLLGEMNQQSTFETIGSSLVQTMLITQAASQRMIPSGQGAIINIASMYGMVSPQPDLYESCPQFHNPPAYGAAKAGIIQFTRYAACHLAKHNIRVNCISPGPFPTEKVQEQSQFIEELKKRVPLHEIGKPKDLVGPAIFLISDASGYVTGHNLVVDGGWTAW